MAEYDIALIGGDRRTAYMVPFLKEQGYRVMGYRLYKTREEIRADGEAESLQQALESADLIVGGIPMEKRGVLCMKEVSRYLRKRHKVFGGLLPEGFCRECAERGIPCYDFMKDEGMAIFNAIATAEGAILEALLHKETNIHGSCSLVLGYGRCGRVLAEKLKGWSARVTVASVSREELAVADSMGLDTLSLEELKKEIGSFSYIYNTIPALVLPKNLLELMQPGVLVVDLASGMGGADVRAAGRLGIACIHCLGLPGKYAAEVSAGKLAEYVLEKCGGSARTGGMGDGSEG